MKYIEKSCQYYGRCRITAFECNVDCPSYEWNEKDPKVTVHLPQKIACNKCEFAKKHEFESGYNEYECLHPETNDDDVWCGDEWLRGISPSWCPRREED